MKNYDETINTVLERIQEYKIAQKRKRKIFATTITSFCCFVLVALIGFGITHKSLFNDTFTTLEGISANNSDESSNDASENKMTDGIKFPDNSQILWADEKVIDNGTTEWNGKKISLTLLNALEAAPKESYLAIAIKMNYVDNQYIYNGKTLAEYEMDVQAEQNLSEKLSLLLKEGKYLKLGEELYLSGTSDGEKWSKELYDAKIEYYGKDLLSKYIQNGEFLQAKAETDLTAINDGNAQKTYDQVYDAYLSHTLDAIQKHIRSQNIACNYQTETKQLIIYATSKEFASLSLENKIEFSFAVKENIGTDDFVYSNEQLD